MEIHRATIPEGTFAWTWNTEPAKNPLVVLHGLGDSAIHTFKPLFTNTMLSRTPTLYLDLPGFGESTASPGFSATIEGYARLIADFLNDLHIEPRAVFGHSMGGTIAILLAQQWPEMVPRLIVAEALLVSEHSVLARTIANRSEESFTQSGFAMLTRATRRQAVRGSVAAESFQHVLSMADPVTMYRAAASLVRPRAPHFGEILCELEMPRTFLMGANTEADTLKLEHHGVRLIRIANAGHSMMVENPHETVEAILSSLD